VSFASLVFGGAHGWSPTIRLDAGPAIDLGRVTKLSGAAKSALRLADGDSGGSGGGGDSGSSSDSGSGSGSESGGSGSGGSEPTVSSSARQTENQVEETETCRATPPASTPPGEATMTPTDIPPGEGTAPATKPPSSVPPGEGTPPVLLLMSFLVAGENEVVVEAEVEDPAIHDNDSLRDSDHDGRCDVNDDDPAGEGVCELENPGEHDASVAADLPYDVRLNVGDTFQLSDAFEGAAPAAITSVDMNGSPWHAGELLAGTPFTVTSADCSHTGNRGVARDRIFVSWTNVDGSTAVDHLDLRYCGQ
jgi:hypothetical protein